VWDGTADDAAVLVSAGKDLCVLGAFPPFTPQVAAAQALVRARAHCVRHAEDLFGVA